MATLVHTIPMTRNLSQVFRYIDYIRHELPTILPQTPALSPVYKVYDYITGTGTSIKVEFTVAQGYSMSQAQNLSDIIMQYFLATRPN